MSAFSELAASFDTAREIVQQPELWGKVLDLLQDRGPEISAFLRTDATFILTGAGSSDYVGRAVAGALRNRLGRHVIAVPTTTFVTHPDSHLIPGHSYVVVHVARSGDSPESLAAYRLLRRARPDALHIVVTCNKAGALRREAAADASALVVTLPQEANDRSLAMTSSFTAMALCVMGLGWLDSLPRLRESMAPVQAGARRVLEEHAEGIAEFSARIGSRACYLGSGPLEGMLHEAALKMLEMTAGKVAAVCDTFLGVRHGPQVFIDERCAIVACLSADPHVRRYELDLLRELRRKGQGSGIMAISVRNDPAIQDLADLHVTLAPRGEEIADELRIFTDLVACQILAFYKSRACGLMPDNPSPGGIINRVVQGVTLYDGLMP